MNMVAPALFELAARAAGPDLGVTTYQEFVEGLARFDRTMMVQALTSMCWRGWAGQLESAALNALARTQGGRMAALAAARCGATGEPPPDPLSSELWRFLAVEDLTSIDAELDRVSAELFEKAAVREETRRLLPSRARAREAASRITFARMLRSQWAAQKHRLDDIYRTWWITKRIDQTGELGPVMDRMLGMEVSRFMRAALTLVALAFERNGVFELADDVAARLSDSLGVTIEDLRLAAFRLSRSFDEFAEWHQRDVMDRASRGFHQHVPNPLSVTPLIRMGDQYLCPSIDLFVGAIDGTFRNTLSSLESDARQAAFTKYGDTLEEYVIAFASEVIGAGNVHRIDKWESRASEKADLLLVEGEFALIIEIKRSLATEVEKSVLDADATVAVLSKLAKAYSQCKTSVRRKPWRRDAAGRNVSNVEGCGSSGADRNGSNLDRLGCRSLARRARCWQRTVEVFATIPRRGVK